MTIPYESDNVNSWDEIDKLNDEYIKEKRFAFRGQSNVGWKLKTSLERAAEMFSIELTNLPKIEEGLIRRYRREAYLYIDHPPDDNDIMQWLSLMQHHGAPTRLLDWTYSFFIALFFALEQVVFNDQGYGECAVWAIDREWLRERSVSQLPIEKREKIDRDEDLKEANTIRILFDSYSPVRSVYQLNPFRLNQRLILQQGFFLAPGDVSQSFMLNIENLFEGKDVTGQFRKIKIHLDREFFITAINRLYRMNISRATLFPGLDGFSASLKQQIPITEAIVTYGLSRK
jgi:hypothetical protein